VRQRECERGSTRECEREEYGERNRKRMSIRGQGGLVEAHGQKEDTRTKDQC
jgi:hypothetical protein